MKTKMKNGTIIKLTLVAAAAILVVYFLSRLPVIFQEGNPWPLVKGIVGLRSQALVRLDLPNEQYLSRANDVEAIESFFAAKDYYFVEQLGAGYIFENNSGQRALAVHRYYSRHYSLWKVSFPDEASIIPEGTVAGRPTKELSENDLLWEEIKEAIATCRVQEVFQAHSLAVKAELKDGRVIEAREPRIDEIIDFVTASGCRGVIMATE